MSLGSAASVHAVTGQSGYRGTVMTEPLDIQCFSHVCIGVSDIERSLTFYRQLLGMDVVFDVELEGASLDAVTGDAGAKGRMIGGLIGGAMVELIGLGGAARRTAGPGGAPLGYTNISFSVTDLDETYRQVIELGFVPEQEPVEIAGVRMFFVKDPDGTPIEIIGYPNGARTSAELWRGAQQD
jgi:glyoxylase I family protein